MRKKVHGVGWATMPQCRINWLWPRRYLEETGRETPDQATTQAQVPRQSPRLKSALGDNPDVIDLGLPATLSILEVRGRDRRQPCCTLAHMILFF
jgi:hypothetical protein